MNHAHLRQVLVHLRAGQWTEAHNLVQQDDSPSAAWLHGIVHIQEGDLEDAILTGKADRLSAAAEHCRGMELRSCLPLTALPFNQLTSRCHAYQSFPNHLRTSARATLPPDAEWHPLAVDRDGSFLPCAGTPRARTGDREVLQGALAVNGSYRFQLETADDAGDCIVGVATSGALAPDRKAMARASPTLPSKRLVAHSQFTDTLRYASVP